MTTEIPRAHCPETGLPLFAVVDSLGRVTSTQDNDDVPADVSILPLFGNEPHANAVTEIVSAPFYCVMHDRVIRAFSTRQKTAAELLAEISWWFAAVHKNERDIVLNGSP
jgi:hypothetical protein